METFGIIKKLPCALIFVYMSALCETSAFSSLSIGDIEPSMNNSTGIAFTDSLILKNHNTAAWTGLANTSFSVSTSFYSHKLSVDGGEDSSYDRFTFEEMSLAMPFGNRNFLGLSYYPSSIVDMTNVTVTEAQVPESFEDTTLRTLKTRKGSVSNASLMYGKGIKDFSFSLGPKFLFGNYEISRRYKYTSYVEGTDIVDWEKHFERKETTQIFHVLMGGGMLYRSRFGLDAGAVFSFPLSTYANKISSFNRTTSYGTVTEVISENEGDYDPADWPFEFGAGLSYKVNKLLLSYDFSAKLFDGVDTGIDETEMKNYTKNTFGLSFDPRNRKYDPYYKRMVYSGYLTFEKRPYDYNGDPVYDISGTLGLNFPFNSDRTNIELRFGYTRSGSKENNGMQCDTFRIAVGFTGSDRWRLRTKRYDD
ncbi:MAG: hypothetical protein WCS93_00930 [Candidatus Delongbacteria bacterium]